MNTCARSTFLLVAICLLRSTLLNAQDVLPFEEAGTFNVTQDVATQNVGLTEHATSGSHGDQIVLASTRCYPSVPGRVLDFNTFFGVECDARGFCTNRQVTLTQNDGFTETWLFVHGNQISREMSVERGVKVYRKLRSCRPDGRPIRFVIWSWPSERTTNRIADAKIKSERTDAESFYLASFLAATADTGPTNILGYSFGSRVVSGALHLNEGGRLCGYYLPSHKRPAEPYRVAFLAAAVESDGLVRGGRYASALNNVDHILLQNNSRDRALRFFWIVDRSKPAALGSTGLRCAPPHCRVLQFDWADAIGKDHSVWQYVDRPIIQQRINETFVR